MTDFALEQKLQIAEKTIEQLRRENAELRMSRALRHGQHETELAAQALVIEKLREALRPLITQRMGAEQIREGIQKALASAPDYTKLLAERDAKYIVVIEKLREALFALEEAARCVQTGEWDRQSIDPERRKAKEALASTPDYTKLLAERDAALLEEIGRYIGGKAQDEINTMAAIIRAGEEV